MLFINILSAVRKLLKIAIVTLYLSNRLPIGKILEKLFKCVYRLNTKALLLLFLLLNYGWMLLRVGVRTRITKIKIIVTRAFALKYIRVFILLRFIDRVMRYLLLFIVSVILKGIFDSGCLNISHRKRSSLNGLRRIVFFIC